MAWRKKPLELWFQNHLFFNLMILYLKFRGYNNILSTICSVNYLVGARI